MGNDLRKTSIVFLGLLTMQLWALSAFLQVWIIAAGVTSLLFAGASLYLRWRPWPVVIRAIIYASIVFAVARTHEGLFNRDAGLSIVCLASILKLMEVRSINDINTLVMLNMILLMGYLIQEQSTAATFFMALVSIISFGVLFSSYSVERFDWRQSLRSSLRILVFSAPLMVLLFIFFPRLSGPLLQNPLSTKPGGGFANDMQPGSIASLVQSDRLVFRAKFKDQSSFPMDTLYWRGQEFDKGEGMSWSRVNSPGARPSLADRIITQEILLEPGFGTWLFALDTPIRIVIGDFRLQASLQKPSASTYALKQAITKSLLYRADSASFSLDVVPTEIHLQLPQDEEARNIANSIFAKMNSDREKIQALDRFFKAQKFEYTLDPGLMQTTKISEFIREKKKGFCEHFSAVYASLLRYAGIPSRVVVGFHGGRYNSYDEVYKITAKDAHAWVEYWLDSRWQRVDPTALVDASRLRLGGQDYFAFPEWRSLSDPARVTAALQSRAESWFHFAQQMIEAANNQWNLFLYQYDADYQKRLFEQFGFGELQRWQLGMFVVGGILVFFFWSWWWAKRKSRRMDAMRRLLRKFLQHLDVPRPANQFAAIEQAIARIESSDLKVHAINFWESYVHARYARGSGLSRAELRQLLSVFLERAKNLRRRTPLSEKAD